MATPPKSGKSAPHHAKGGTGQQHQPKQHRPQREREERSTTLKEEREGDKQHRPQIGERRKGRGDSNTRPTSCRLLFLLVGGAAFPSSSLWRTITF